MTITGYLSDFSLPEIFRFLDKGHKSGLLSMQSLPQDSDTPGKYYIWLSQGRIVAAAQRLDRQGLLTLIEQRGWMTGRAAHRLTQQCVINVPVGLCLKSQGVLQAEQLKLLFYTQVMRQVCALFALKDAWFQFDPKSPLPTEEMTGLNVPASEVTLPGLRALRDWSALEDKLPSPSSGLVSAIASQPSVNLNQEEWQVWEFTKGTVPLSEIADQLNLSLTQTQRIAFRLMAIGLAEEVPLVNIEESSTLMETMPDTALSNYAATPANVQGEATAVSQSFLHNLVGFLKGRTG